MAHNRETLITAFQAVLAGGSKVEPYRLDGREGDILRLHDGDEILVRRLSPVQGWHNITIAFAGANGIRVRLSGEPFFR